MQRFSGLEIKPYSQLTELPRVRIDRVRVEVQRTLFGETEYHLVGTLYRAAGCMGAEERSRKRHF